MEEAGRAEKNRICASVRKRGKTKSTLLMITASVMNTTDTCKRKNHHRNKETQKFEATN
jgi:hypothetical protein